MLTGMKILVMGGDARQLEVIKKLNELDAQLSLVGFDQLDHYFNGASKVDLDDIDWAKLDALILPVSGANDEGRVETIFSDQNVVIKSEWLKQTPPHFTIYTGIKTKGLNECADQADRNTVALFSRDDVAIYNSIPTVEGTLMMVIQNTDITIHSSDVMILGLGRTGMSLARAFHHLGGNVRVGTKHAADIARIKEMGLTPFHIDHLVEEVKDVDICVNTIPDRILTGRVLSQMPVTALIVDIASKPGGTDFRYAEKRGVKAMLAPGLPGIVASKTAGQIIANVLTELLEDQWLRKDDDGGD